MDAMDILGSLLGSKSKSGSPAGNILKDILTGGGRKPGQPQPRQPQPGQPQPAPPRRTSAQGRQHPRARQPQTIGDAARSLEELLNVSNEHHQSRRQPAPAQRSPQPQPPQRSPSKPPPHAERDALNEQATVLVRAMVSAAKSDGQISKDEQDKIVQQLGQADQASIEFLRAEFAKPVDVRGLAWNIPRGMEEQAYTVSLIAIDLDEQKEAEYLADLCQGLRLDPQRCNEIHRNFGAPVIFRG